MGRIIVNKHINGNQPITRNLFHDEIELAKGEIIIVNDEKPSIFVIDAKGEPQQISGNNSISEEVLNAIKKELSDAISTLENTILGYTINDIPLSENPILNGENIKIEGYENINIANEINENVIDSDAIQTAIKKVETMVFMNAMATSASLNDINRKSIQKIHHPQIDNEYYVLSANSLNIIKNALSEINFKFDSMIDDVVNYCEVLFATDDIIEEINLPIEFSNISLDELKPNTRYLFKIKYNFVEIVELKEI